MWHIMLSCALGILFCCTHTVSLTYTILGLYRGSLFEIGLTYHALCAATMRALFVLVVCHVHTYLLSATITICLAMTLSCAFIFAPMYGMCA